ncbi:hypothetical protein M5K25_017314 [Dendrobium thyrsiflorum]|uniref:Uncharacterized protein n=1 Tax=Dendrobium thyrsiflorum TaxID=117978 RepID=A0ABD0UMF4_DENTH
MSIFSSRPAVECSFGNASASEKIIRCGIQIRPKTNSDATRHKGRSIHSEICYPTPQTLFVLFGDTFACEIGVEDEEEEDDEEAEGSGEARFAGDETPSGQIRRGKLRSARDPRILYAARSYATAASSAVSKVPSQTLAPFFAGSLISAANFPHGRCLTPR